MISCDVITAFTTEHIFFHRQLLLCRVALGKSFLQFNAMKMAHAPPGHHSVVGRPSVGGLSFPEYVVYRGEQVKHQFIHTAPKWTNNIHIHHLFSGLPGVFDLLPDCETRGEFRRRL